jgi:hypothetical protein
MPGASGCDMPELIRIGTAGWAIPRSARSTSPRDGRSLERYAARFTAVEINSTLHRSHKSHTFARWGSPAVGSARTQFLSPRAVVRRRLRGHGCEALDHRSSVLYPGGFGRADAHQAFALTPRSPQIRQAERRRGGSRFRHTAPFHRCEEDMEVGQF